MSHRSTYRFLWWRQRLPKENTSSIRAVKKYADFRQLLDAENHAWHGTAGQEPEEIAWQLSEPAIYFTSGLMKTREPRRAPPGPAMRSRLQRISPGSLDGIRWSEALDSRVSWHGAGAFQVLSWSKGSYGRPRSTSQVHLRLKKKKICKPRFMRS